MSSKRRFTRSCPTSCQLSTVRGSLLLILAHSRGVRWSSPATFALVLLSLGVEASDAGVDLGLLVVVDPPRRYPFG